MLDLPLLAIENRPRFGQGRVRKVRLDATRPAAAVVRVLVRCRRHIPQSICSIPQPLVRVVHLPEQGLAVVQLPRRRVGPVENIGLRPVDTAYANGPFVNERP